MSVRNENANRCSETEIATESKFSQVNVVNGKNTLLQFKFTTNPPYKKLLGQKLFN